MRRPPQSEIGSQAGFSLLEILMVISIMIILLAIGGGVMNQTRSPSTSMPLVEALFGEARSLAIGQRTRTRVVFHADSADTERPERFLRFVTVAVAEEDSNGDVIWNAMGTNGTLLPHGSYFDHAASEKASDLVQTANPAGVEDAITGFGRWKLGAIDFPGTPTSLQDCYFYEFNSEGICVHDGDTRPGGAVILSAGNGPEGETPILSKANKVGFIVWRNGNTSTFQNTADLQD